MIWAPTVFAVGWPQLGPFVVFLTVSAGHMGDGRVQKLLMDTLIPAFTSSSCCMPKPVNNPRLTVYGEVPTISLPTPCLPFFQTGGREIIWVTLIHEIIKLA
jgi:hypothetical protein